MIKCPKCQAEMEKVSYGKNIEIDRCVRCMGIWLDIGEMEQLQGRWMSEELDPGDPKIGRINNIIENVLCPHCHERMTMRTHSDNSELWFETCSRHGVYFDAGEFAATQREAMMKQFQGFLAASQKEAD